MRQDPVFFYSYIPIYRIRVIWRQKAVHSPQPNEKSKTHSGMGKLGTIPEWMRIIPELLQIPFYSMPHYIFPLAFH